MISELGLIIEGIHVFALFVWWLLTLVWGG